MYVLRRHVVPAVLVSVMDSIPLDIGTAVLDFLAIADEYDEKESEEGGTSVRRRNSLSQTNQNEQKRRLITEANLSLEILLIVFFFRISSTCLREDFRRPARRTYSTSWTRTPRLILWVKSLSFCRIIMKKWQKSVIYQFVFWRLHA